MRCRKEQHPTGCYLVFPHHHLLLEKEVLEPSRAWELVMLWDYSSD